MEEPYSHHNRRSSGLAFAAGLLLTIYLFFPILFLAPLVKAHNVPKWTDHIVEGVFWPQQKLYSNVPLYKNLIEYEKTWFAVP